MERISEQARIKHCSRCGEDKPADASHFSRRKRSVDGFVSWCKPCMRAYQKRYEQEGRETPPPPTHERLCKRCNRTFPMTTEFFHKKAGGRNGLLEMCKECNREHTLSYNGGRQRPLMPAKEGKRYCRGCNEYKPEDRAHFPRRDTNHVGLDTTCRQCMNRRASQWARENPLTSRAWVATRRARSKAAPGKFTRQDVERQIQTQDSKCFWCDDELSDAPRMTHIDHFIPLSRGGSNYPSNLVIACQNCNLRKHDKMPWEWMPERFSPPNADAAD